MLLHSRRKTLLVSLLGSYYSSLAVAVVVVAVALQGPRGETTSPYRRRTIAIKEGKR